MYLKLHRQFLCYCPSFFTRNKKLGQKTKTRKEKKKPPYIQYCPSGAIAQIPSAQPSKTKKYSFDHASCKASANKHGVNSF